jgi:hypothetical protein
MKKYFLFLFVILFLSLLIFSQVRGGDIYGKVSITLDGQIFKIMVTATHEDVKITNITNEKGEFYFKNLPPGGYELTFQQEGKESIIKRGICVESGQFTRVVMNMRTGEIKVKISKPSSKFGDTITLGKKSDYGYGWPGFPDIPFKREIQVYRVEGTVFELDLTTIRQLLIDARIKEPFTFELRVEKDNGHPSFFLPYGGDEYHEVRMDLELKDEKKSESRKPFLFESPEQIPHRILLPAPLEGDWFQKPHQIIFKNEKGEVQASLPISVVRGPMSNELK